MTDDELKAIRERVENATPGEWVYEANLCIDVINASRTDVVRLLDEVERLRKRVQMLERVIDEATMNTLAAMGAETARTVGGKGVAELMSDIHADQQRVRDYAEERIESIRAGARRSKSRFKL